MANCNTQQLNITCGTDVVLHDRLIFDGETFDPNLSDDVAANLTSSLGKCTALDVQIVGDALVIDIPWADGRLPGCYGLEVTGTCNGKKWASHASSLIHYTKGTEQGATEVTVESDSYDITQVVAFRYGPDGTSVEMHNRSTEAHPYLQEAIGGKVDDVLVDGSSIVTEVEGKRVANIGSLDFGKVDDVKVNGTSVVTGKVASVSVPTKTSEITNDSTYQTAQQVQQAIEENLVPNAAATVDGSTGTPSVTVTKSGNTLNFAFSGLKGTKGDKGDTGATGQKGATGDSAVYDPSSPDTPDFVMANEMGQFTTKAMTQKAVTDEIIDKTIISWSTISKTKISSARINESGIVVSAVSSWRILYCQISAGDIVRCSATNGDYSSLAVIAFFSGVPSTGSTGDIVKQNTGDITAQYIAQNNGYLAVTIKSSDTATFTKGIGVISKLSEVDGEISQIKTDVRDLGDSTKVFTTIADRYADSFVIWRIIDDKWASTSYAYSSQGINVSRYRGMTIRLTPRHSDSAFAFVKSEGSSTGESVRYSETPPYDGLISFSTETTAVIPHDATILYLQTYRGGSSNPSLCSLVQLVESVTDSIVAITRPFLHVNAVSGNDGNNGLSASSPLATFAKAFSLSGQDIRVILHGDTNESFTPPSANSVTLVAANGEKARIIKGVTINDDDAVLDTESGIYTFDCSNINFGNGRTLSKYWIYQFGVDDSSTEISVRHPLQRDCQYRCGSTCLKPKALAELQEDETPAYYYDATNQVLHFRIVSGTSLSNNPVVLPTFQEHGIAISDQTNIKIVGIEVLFGDVFLNRCNDVDIYDCAARYAYSDGCFRYNSSRGVRFTRCEASRAIAGSSDTGGGDGFNGHIDENISVSGVRRLTATMIDCWSHDNNDDGYSDHNRSESTIVGGLFENNGKGGITPSFGSCDTILGATCRHNTGAGILYTGAVSSGTIAKAGVLLAKNCSCEGNGGCNYRCNNSNSAEYPNIMILEQCISKEAGEYGYRAENSKCKMFLTDCTDKLSTSGAAINVTIDNTSVVS